MNVLPNELNERVIMCIRGFINENLQLLDNWSKDSGKYLDSIVKYFDGSGVDFGKYAVSNLYLSNNDETEIINFSKREQHRYCIEYDEHYDDDDLENIIDNSNNFTNIKDKINNFIGLYIIINIEIIFDLINDIYANKDNEVYLK